VRAFRGVGGTPPFIVRGRASRIWDADGNEYIDYVGSWGPLILGHADPGVLRAVRAAMARGTSFGAPTELEIELAELICEALPAYAASFTRLLQEVTDEVTSPAGI